MKKALFDLVGLTVWVVTGLSTGTALGAESVQLYLTDDVVPKKGYIDASQVSMATGTDKKVAFRECDAPAGTVEWIDPKSLTAITGNCEKIWALWGGTVSQLTDSMVTILTPGNDALTVDPKEWRKAFGNDTSKWPSVGDAVGGYNAQKPFALFAIAPKLSPSN